MQKRILTVLLAFGVVMLCIGGAFALFWLSGRPPRETTLIGNFRAHQLAYERLRDMLIADQQVEAVYVDFGVETADSGLPRQPSEVKFPADRYGEYTGLLKQIGSNAAFRSRKNLPELICVGVWASGWAGDTRHIWVCWTDHEPTVLVTSLDDYYRDSDSNRPRNVSRRIDGDWYLRADW